MIVFKSILGLQNYLQKKKQKGLSVGFVPTMGALHQGHISLINAANKQVDITVCSVFVNPTQFNDSKDFERYPVTIEDDILLLEKNNCDVLFLPSVVEMYPNGIVSSIHYDLGFVETVLEGAFRPGHFQGVCQVVHLLLKIVQPEILFLGQKDYQQCMVLKKMLTLTKLDQSVTINICPILREPSGLAMSSRNVRLTGEQKEKATVIFKSLLFIQKNIYTSSIDALEQKVKLQLLDNGFEQIDYVAVANANDLSLIEQWDKKTPIIALIAGFIGGVRLIDNMILN
jgi:pantoate--beta-alanine ligase